MRLQEALSEILPDNIIQDKSALKKLEDALLVRGAPRDGISILHQAVPTERKKPKVILQFLEVDTEEEIKEKVQDVVLHEVGHYFGLDERTLRDIESAGRLSRKKGDRT
jgi:hypothetical protein